MDAMLGWARRASRASRGVVGGEEVTTEHTEGTEEEKAEEEEDEVGVEEKEADAWFGPS